MHLIFSSLCKKMSDNLEIIKQFNYASVEIRAVRYSFGPLMG